MGRKGRGVTDVRQKHNRIKDTELNSRAYFDADELRAFVAGDASAFLYC